MTFLQVLRELFLSTTGYQRELRYKRKSGSYSAFGNRDAQGSMMYVIELVSRDYKKIRAPKIMIDKLNDQFVLKMTTFHFLYCFSYLQYSVIQTRNFTLTISTDITNSFNPVNDFAVKILNTYSCEFTKTKVS